jgi:hypothetical protein
MTSTHQAIDDCAAPMAQSLPGDETPPRGPGTTDPSAAETSYDRRREQVRRAQK